MIYITTIVMVSVAVLSAGCILYIYRRAARGEG